MSPSIKNKNRAVFNEAIGGRLEKVRREVNYSVSQMASAMGISSYTYRSNIKGNNTPLAGVIVFFCFPGAV
ncbi:MAG: helix-turn-helix transcriptional regulator [bacterium]|nr:helix-turn-helix transcriptional regulator [bacterium]